MAYDPSASRKALVKREARERLQRAKDVAAKPWEHSRRELLGARKTLLDAGFRNLALTLDPFTTKE